MMDEQQYKKRLRQLGALIAFYRRERNMTQDNLAEAIGKEKPTISKIEQGVNGPSIRTLFDIADVLGVPPHKLLKFFDEDE